MPLTPDDVRTKQFTPTRLRPGYDEDEVDDFLDEVEAELARLLKGNAELVGRVAELEQQLASVRAKAAATAPSGERPDHAALRIIAMAQRTADETIADAGREAEQLLADARARASALEREAEEKNHTIVAALQAQREQLERRIAELDAFAREHQARLRAYLQAQLHDLDANDSGSPPALRAAGAPAPGETEERSRRNGDHEHSP